MTKQVISLGHDVVHQRQVFISMTSKLQH